MEDHQIHINDLHHVLQGVFNSDDFKFAVKEGLTNGVTLKQIISVAMPFLLLGKWADAGNAILQLVVSKQVLSQ